MTSTPPSLQTYLHDTGSPVFTVFHPPAPDAARTGAVLLCPPFGWEEVSSYRPLRTWAQQLAGEGYATLRLTLPGTGDSGGQARDPDHVRAWTDAVALGAQSLRRLEWVQQVTVIGLGIGATLAYWAVALGAPIDDLVLWGARARGRDQTRELRAISRVESPRFFEGLEPPPPAPAGQLEAGGFVLAADTVAQLDALDLTSLPLPPSAHRRLLLLERDGISVDERLVDAARAGGAEVTISPGDGYAEMTAHPQHARAASEVLAHAIAWLGPGSGAAGSATASGLPGASDSVRLPAGTATSVRESPLRIEQPFGALAGILSEPPGDSSHELCAVLLNAGAIRRIGPNRMWVEAARRWAAASVPTLRLDIEGLGESDGDAARYVTSDEEFYVPEIVPQVLRAIDVLQQRGIGQRFLLCGLCSGAYWSFEAARRDARVISAVMINPAALVWDSGIGPARDLRALVSGRASLSGILREATVARVGAVAHHLVTAPARRARRLRSSDGGDGAVEAEIDRALEELQRGGKDLTFVFREGEALQDELVRSGRMSVLERSPNVTLEHIAVRDHTLRPTWAQARAHEALDRALHRTLAVSGSLRSADESAPAEPVA